MSKITLTPHASGTGTLNIAAPNTNSTRTLTLPDADLNLGNVLTTASSLASANLTGALPAIDGAALTGLSAGGTELLSTATMTGSAVDITLPTSGYSKLTLMYKGAGITLNTNQWVYIRCSTDGGSTFDTTFGNYSWTQNGFASTLTYNNDSSGTSQMNIHFIYNVASSSLALDINNNGTTTGPTTFNGHSLYVNDAGSLQHNIHGCRYKQSTVVNAIRLLPSGGTFNAGTAYLYGWKV